MSYHRNKYNAARNINQEKGFECPTCNSYVPRGRDVCYNCGDMPASGTSHSSDDGIGGCSTFFFFIFLFVAPILYYSTRSIESYDVHMLFLIPNLIMFLSSLITLIKWNFYTGCMSVPVRLWIIAYSGLALWNFIKLFFI